MTKAEPLGLSEEDRALIWRTLEAVDGARQAIAEAAASHGAETERGHAYAYALEQITEAMTTHPAYRPCETIGPEDLEPGCCEPCRSRAARSQPIGVARGWLPIETAPKDGTEIILLIWGVATQGAWTGPSDGAIYSGRPGTFNWATAERTEHDTGVTHWMPLPIPPTVTV